jgi:hypothetical protein
MKKISIILLTFFLTITSLYSQTDDKKIRIKVPSIDEEGNITETVYAAEYPSNYNEAINDIDLLVEIYEDVTKNYKEQIEEDKKYIAKILEELNAAKEKNKALETIDSATTNVDIQKDKSNKTIKDQFESFGIIGEYGVINDSNEISVQFGIKLWKFTFAAGPNISIPKTQDNKVDFGFRGSIGFWF